MLEPKFVPYLTDKKLKTEHGYEYIALKEDAPKDIKDEYMDLVDEQDKRIKNGEMIMR